MKTYIALFMFITTLYTLLDRKHSYEESSFGNQRVVRESEYNKTHPIKEKIELVRPKTEQERALIIADIWGIEARKN